MSEMTGNSIELLERAEIQNGILCVLKNSNKHQGQSKYFWLQDYSNSLQYIVMDSLMHTDWPTWVCVYLGAYTKLTPSNNEMLLSKTPSPHTEKNRIKLLIEKMVALEHGSVEKRIQLNEKFFKEKQKYMHYFKGAINEDLVDKLFSGVLETIVQIPYSAAAIEITPDKSIFFDLRMGETVVHFKLMIADKDAPMAFFAIYRKAICYDNGVGPVDEISTHLLNIIHGGVPSDSVAQRDLQIKD